MDTTWAWALTAVIAVGLPGAAWLLSRNHRSLSRNHRSQGQHTAHLGFGAIDRWLAEHYRLSALDRWQIEEVIFRDARKLEDPRLRQAARGLAAELLNGRLMPRWPLRWIGWAIAGLGLAITVIGIVMLTSAHRQGALGALYVIEGPVWIMLGAVLRFRAPQRLRRNLMRLHDDQIPD